MANNNAPFGLRYVGTGTGSAPNFAMANTSTTRIVYNNATAIFQNDPVMWDDGGGGYLERWVPTTGVSQLAGIFVGCEYLGSNGSWTRSNYWPGGGNSGTGDIIAHIVPLQVAGAGWFLAQTGDSNTTAAVVTIADVGRNVDVAMGSGNTRTGMSTAYIDMNTDGTAATLPFTIVGVYTGTGVYGAGVGSGSESSAYNWVYVQANTNQRTGI
jgi:hypothetical protein